jgi:hypothetical protein
MLLGTGTGSFGAATNFNVGELPRSVAAGDFNGDGTLDLAVASFGASSNGVSILINGCGVPTQTPTPPTTTPTHTPTPPPTQTATPTRSPTLTAIPCIGDCSGRHTVAIDDLITLVNIVLGDAEPSACPNGVPTGAEVDIVSVIQAVNNALHGCGAG